MHRTPGRKGDPLVRSPGIAAEGKHVTTIEGLSTDLTHPLQKAWIELDVPQCGYCQSGQIMSAAVLLAEIQNLQIRISMRRWAAISAAVEPTRASGKPFTGRRN